MVHVYGDTLEFLVTCTLTLKILAPVHVLHGSLEIYVPEFWMFGLMGQIGSTMVSCVHHYKKSLEPINKVNAVSEKLNVYWPKERTL